jgi:hypothetical protein
MLMNEHQPIFVQQAVGQISNRVDELYPVIVQQPVAELLWFKTLSRLGKNYKAADWAMLSRRVGNAVLPTNLICNAKRWAKKLAHPTKLEVEIKQQLAGLKYE